MTADLQGDEATLLALYEKAFANESTGFTLLHTAAGKGHDRVVELLLQRGTEVDLQDNTGCTALRVAAYKCHLRVVEPSAARRRGQP